MKTRGFTLLEVLLVVTILAIAFGFFTLYSQNTQIRTDLNAQTAVLVSHLRLAQSNASSGNTTGYNAIHLDAANSNYTAFIGATFDAQSATNTVVQLPTTISFQNILLNGGGTDIVFNGPEGETTNYGTFEIFLSSTSQSHIITISEIGTVNY
ncbi:prepilin-type N-terminal cleavage/methylation domain-containing protein [Candidatus Peregrinibacteria bacterium]|nr:prepilin-type N-terminal cleavage/methylation domain-containing protein [Candidatus Peregrinibacteria bacterium]